MKAIHVAECIAPYVAEFIGTFFVIFAIGCSVANHSGVWIPTCVGFAAMVTMYSTSASSGGHLNPALTLSFALCGKLEWTQALLYWTSQVLAGFAASAMCTKVFGENLQIERRHGFDWLDVLVVEVVFTTMFCFVGLNCMASTRINPKTNANQFFALAVGFVYIASGKSTLEIVGGYPNPAATLGFGFVYADATLSHAKDVLLVVGFQLGSSVLAALLFFLVRPEELSSLGIRVAPGAPDEEGLRCGMVCRALCCFSRPPAEDSDVETSEAAPADAKVHGDYSPFPARWLSEFLGTYVLVFTGGLMTAFTHMFPDEGTLAAPTAPTTVAPGQHGEPVSDEYTLPTSMVAWATGAAVLSMMYAVGRISGGHFNPAVTLAVVLSGRGKCSMAEGLSYMIAQTGAGSLATLSYLCVRRGASLVNPDRVSDLGPKHGYRHLSVAVGESVFTMAIALAVLCMMTVRSPKYAKAPASSSFQSALTVGMCVSAGSLALGGISGGILNPALSLALTASNIVHSGFKFGDRLTNLIWYVASEFAGGVLAAIIFVLSHPYEYKKDPLLSSS